MSPQKSGKVLGPSSKLAGSNTNAVVLVVLQDTENPVGKEFCNGSCHSCEAIQEKADWVPAVKIERSTSVMCCICPRVEMVQPERRSKSGVTGVEKRLEFLTC